MRAIKFRVWINDKENRDYLGYGMTTLDYSGFPFDDDHECRDVKGNEFLCSDLTYLQFTGLTDRNGREIYEWDIVECLENEFYGVVYFDRGSFWVRELHTSVDEGIYDGDVRKETKWSIDLDCQIIGNVWENPELLKDYAQ